MDPELVKEMKERQDKMFNVQSKLQSGDIGGGYAIPIIHVENP